MKLKNYSRNHKKRKEYIKQNGKPCGVKPTLLTELIMHSGRIKAI